MKVLPSGFLPSPRVYGHNTDGNLMLCKPGNVDKTVKYASLSNILAQPVDQDVPFDSYNRKVNLTAVVCPFCNLSLCSPAEYGRHRRAMHYKQRAPAGYELSLDELDQRDLVTAIIDENCGEFLCVMEDIEDVEWKRLGASHPLIAEYRKERERLLEGVNDGPVEIPDSELDEFMSSMWEAM